MARDLDASLYEDEKAKLVLSTSEPAQMRKYGFMAGLILLPIILLVVSIVYGGYVGVVVGIAKTNQELAKGVTAEGEAFDVSVSNYLKPVTENWSSILLGIIPGMLLTGILGGLFAEFHAKGLKKDKPFSLYFSWGFFFVIFMIYALFKINLAWYFNLFLAVFAAGVLGYTVLAFWKTFYTRFMFRHSQGVLMNIFDMLEAAMDEDPNLRRVYVIDWDRIAGKVTVGGAVDNLKRKDKVEELMKSIEGVKEVDNRCRHRYG
ncbi:MAG: BON domain-containing protein [Bacillota bacterium]|nr:BON domain-containing protein [Bacillota bacterium]